MIMSCSAEVEANRLLEELTKGDDFTLPDIDMSGPEWDIPGGDDSPIFGAITKITNESLTTREVGGSGTFDALMESAHNHLKAEFKANRITGGEYTKAYIAMMESCMSNAVQFLLGRDQAYWAAALAQIQAVTARVTLATSKAQYVLAKIQALSAKSEYALTKLKIATESETYCAALFNASQMLPQQLKLLTEQTEAQRAQTLDTRTDGAVVKGSVGKQKELYSQQITSYQRDAEVKASKLFTDAWITQKTIDEGLNPPNGFTNASIDTILTKLKSNNGLN
ncbi:putative tail protein [Escherichia phage St11Ph5]|uniref:Putative tail protein n=1 Tax=Escherichia phage St11Ph5 TaxID=2047765 RepID=A0A2D2W389_9CAUD|nr:virion structural protein [Escherichia phage St11Ph5]ATS92529.1 putative tail protein [Escherichia phage St11Ph5]